ncbi:uncharacterized protein BP5553_10448 [Venustampulla echinocandica]|uniref:DNA polymerase n=1 Tax=Venustampulla echinocandica TaxID=2656787 RepID=A0A370T9C4_9HELO|nr:uncharacterized protein BP5553_10448 [Venustampulla echinocandica]RDL30170.1 hypothetical protein BP5553_10448 [Venustampulla echinocandica]
MDLSFPPIYLLKSHFERNLDELHKLETQIDVVFDITEAKLVLGKVNSKARAQYDLRTLGLFTKEVEKDKRTRPIITIDEGERSHPTKRRKAGKNGSPKAIIVIDSSTASEPETESESKSRRPAAITASPTSTVDSRRRGSNSRRDHLEHHGDTIKVLKLSWYTDSLASGKLLPIDDYLVYEGKILDQPKDKNLTPNKAPITSSIVSSARIDAPNSRNYFHKRRRTQSESQAIQSNSHPSLLPESTMEKEEVDNLPPVPDSLLTKYSCERPTPVHSPNDAFVSQLRIIKKARILAGGTHAHSPRAYGAAIATILAYPYTLTTTHELLRLPNCGPKFATLFQEWKDTGRIKEVEEIQQDEKLKCLGIFYEIFDVGEHTAREFYRKGWRDLEDVIEHGWSTLTRTQQIGVKYYDDFLMRIPREEVEKIGNIVLDHANKLRPGFQMVICGGYRRGKVDSGDVDIIMSHPDEESTAYFLEDLLFALEKSKYIRHTLKLSTRNSDRYQNPVSWKGGERRKGGFDTLDHMFVDWQDQDLPIMDDDMERDPDAVNPNPHRRVDVIISPWKTAGCAVLGWTGATFFERHLREYCRQKLGYKFDSSGVRKVQDGSWVDLEKGPGDLLAKEKRLFEGLGLTWREPTERCTD